MEPSERLGFDHFLERVSHQLGAPRGTPVAPEAEADALEDAREQLPRATRVLERGIEAGLQFGTQMHVTRHGETVASFAMGWGREGVPMRRDMLIPWFCCVKPLVVIGLAQLWERGLVDLEAPVAEVIPEFACNGKSGVTFVHLLTHTGGLRPDPLSDGSATGPEAALARVCAAELGKRVIPGLDVYYGTMWSWLIFSEAIRRVDGREYRRYLQDEVLSPLGADEVRVGPEPREVAGLWPRLGMLYDVTGREATAVTHPAAALGFFPGMEGLGSARSLARIFESLAGTAPGRPVLARQTAAALTARQRVGLYDFNFETHLSWGLGVNVDGWHYGRYCSARTFGHTGLKSSLALCDPDVGLVIGAITNGLPSYAKGLARDRALVDAVYADLGIARLTRPAPRVTRSWPDGAGDLRKLVLGEHRRWQAAGLEHRG